MKKITKILSLTVVVASMMTPLALLANNTNNVNVKQEVNEVADDSTGGLDNIDIDSDNQTIDINSTIDNDKVIGEKIVSNDCTAEDSGQTTTAWMGITKGFVIFDVLKEYVGESNIGEVMLDVPNNRSITSTYFKIPNHIVFNNKKYNVIRIAEDANQGNDFRNCTGLIGTLTIPANVTTIGNFAFQGCTGLTSLNLSNATSLTTIGDYAFNGCTGLTGPLTIPASVTTIDDGVFTNCNFTSISVETGNTKYCMATNLGTTCQAVLEITTNGIFNSDSKVIGSLAFGELVLPSDLAKIANNAFWGCSGLTGTFAIPTTVTSIGSFAFSECTGLTSLDLSNATNLTTIGLGAFSDCTGLTSLELSNTTNLTTIDDFAFRNCTGLTGTLTIPASVTSIGNGVFTNCNFTSISVETGNTKYCMATNLGSNCYVVLDIATNGIFDSNSKNFKDLTIGELVLPNTLTSIDDKFSGCTGLTSLDLTNATNLTILRGFGDCTGLTTLTIPASVTSIGSYAFSNCTGLTGTLTIPASVTSIGSYAFSNCTGLTTLTIPASVTSIGSDAFIKCEFTSIEVNPLNQKYALASKQSVGSANVVIDKTIFPDLNYDYISRPVAALACGPLTIPASVTSIGSYTFRGCTGLTKLDLSSAANLKTIGGNAFNGCTGLTGTLTIPASVTTIGSSAFEDCTGLTSLDLSNATNLTTIVFNAFNGCTGLTSLDLSNATSLTIISNGVFYNCTGLTTLTIPDSVTSIGNEAFYNCTGLTGTLTIPDSVTEIGNEAFSNAGSQDFKFLSLTPPPTLGTNIFGTNVTKTLLVPNAQAKIAYDQYAVNTFGLADSSYIKVTETPPASVDITNLNGSYTINLNETNKTIATARADVQPNDATNKAVTWSLENAPAWLKIDANGNIFADDNLKNTTPGKFTFKVKVVCQADPTISNTTGDIELNVIQQENTDSFAWWWLLVAEAGALLLIGVISISVIVVKNKKNK